MTHSSAAQRGLAFRVFEHVADLACLGAAVVVFLFTPREHVRTAIHYARRAFSEET